MQGWSWQASLLELRAERSPVSSGSETPLRRSNQRGDITQVYLSARSRFCGRGVVVWFHGCR